jgi:hypothetical protein
LPVSVTVRVRAGNIEDVGAVTITQEPAGAATTSTTPVEDLVRVPFSATDFNQPVFALATGTRGEQAVQHEVHAFVGFRLVADLGGAGAVVVFSTDHEVAYRYTPWFEGVQDVVEFRGSFTDGVPRLGPPVPVKVNVWDATSGGAASLDDLELARVLFRANRTGIEIGEPDDRIDRLPEAEWGDVEVSHTEPYGDCGRLKLRFGSLFDGANAGRKDLHVILVDDLGGYSGYACDPAWHPTVAARVVFIDIGDPTTGDPGAGNVTLAHELGHMFGLVQPASGHSQCVGGFDESNLMRTGLDDRYTEFRRRLSLGQAFRVSLDELSAVNTSGARAGSSLSCHEQDAWDPYTPAGACPPLPHPASRPPGWQPPVPCALTP